MKNDLRNQLNTALRDMDWNGEAQVMEIVRGQRRPVRRMMPSKALAFAAVLVMMLATTAAALTFHFSARYDAQRSARQAVMTAYGLTDEMLDLFTYTEADGGAETVATFAMTYAHGDRLGIYTVRRAADGALSASWSHDGADAALLDSGSLASPAWGKKQLERILPAYREQAANWASMPDDGELSLEEWAALDAPLPDIREAGMLIHIAPGESDISAEKAEEIAREAIAEKYGVAGALSGDVHIGFLLHGGTDRREYRIETGEYLVMVESPSGAVTRCRWLVAENERTLPDGDLSLYPAAAEEFVTSGAFALLDAEEKAAVTKRYADAGLASLLPRSDYAAPSDGDLPEADALDIAAAALEEACGLPEGWEALFTHRASLVAGENGGEWVVEYQPDETVNWHWPEDGKLGVYTACVDAQTGGVIFCDWSFDDVQTDAYTEQNFAGAPAFDGSMIPWVRALLDDLQMILSRYPQEINLSEMTLEDRGAYAARMREAGYPAAQYPDLIPEEADMPQDEAAALAWDAIGAVYDVSGLSLARGEAEQEGLYMVKRADGTWIRAWNIVYTNNMELFTVYVNAGTGEIEDIRRDGAAFGNG